MKLHSVQPGITQPAIAPVHVRRIVLAGFMGAGKSTAGRLLADRLGWEFLDLDAVIEARAGTTVPAIFAAHGERHFRGLEAEALAAALDRDNIVLALGGGALETVSNGLLLEQTPGTATIFLDAPFQVLYDRCVLQALSINNSAGPAQLRPVLADSAAAEARFLARRPVYHRVASHVLDTSRLNTSETVTALIALLHSSDRSSS